jgi:small-conductance mechanosensitive channel
VTAEVPGAPTTHTVEEVVRKQLSDALGGVRGMLEAAVPTIAFTVIFLTAHDLRLAIIVSVACAGVLLAVRLAQRSTPQFVLNALVGIGIGALFAWRAARGGGDEGDQALAYFLPGLLYNLVYGVVMLFTVAIRWPLVGFIVGSVAGDPTAWHADRHVVRLCSKLTWMLALPCVLRVVVQAPIYLAGRNGWWSTDSAVAALGVAKLTMGWPVQVAALAAMAWMLTRNHTPLRPGEPEPQL